MPAQKLNDAIKLLTQDHKDVDALFKRYDKLCESGGSSAQRAELARQICAMLTMHTTIEEEIFYPAARAALIAHEFERDLARVAYRSIDHYEQAVEQLLRDRRRPRFLPERSPVTATRPELPPLPRHERDLGPIVRRASSSRLPSRLATRTPAPSRISAAKAKSALSVERRSRVSADGLARNA